MKTDLWSSSHRRLSNSGASTSEASENRKDQFNESKEAAYQVIIGVSSVLSIVSLLCLCLAIPSMYSYVDTMSSFSIQDFKYCEVGSFRLVILDHFRQLHPTWNSKWNRWEHAWLKIWTGQNAHPTDNMLATIQPCYTQMRLPSKSVQVWYACRSQVCFQLVACPEKEDPLETQGCRMFFVITTATVLF